MSNIRTPGAVIGAATIMFVYAALLLICVGCAGIGLAAKDPNDALGMEAMLDKEAPGHMAVGIAGAAFNLLFCLTLLACGIGLLFLSKIARIGAYLVCMAIPIVTLAGTIYNILVVFPVQERVMAQQFQAMQQQQGPAPFDFGMIIKGSAALGLIIAIGIPVLFCGPTIILLSVKSARMAFAGETAQPPEERERDPRHSGYDDDDYPGKDDRRAPPDTGIQDRS